MKTEKAFQKVKKALSEKEKPKRYYLKKEKPKRYIF